MNDLSGKTAVVTGGTDGIGAATAYELRARGANVTIIGRSQDKADALLERAAALPGPGSMKAITADFRLMRTAQAVAGQVADEVGTVDLILNAVGILISHRAHTSEGIELDFAVGYLSRYVFLETLAARGTFTASTRLVTIAASSPKIPRFAQLEFHNLAEVEARSGMTSHGQAQLANDLLTAQAAARYGVTAIGYGPGSVDTNIRREVSPVIRALIKPFFARTTRTPEEVAHQLADIFTDPAIAPRSTRFYNKNGQFTPAEFITNPTRQAELLSATIALTDKALSRPQQHHGN